MKPSGIITVTTDFGIHDPYVAIMKGVMLSINPRVNIIDVTHQITPGALFQAANIIEEAAPYFPRGTVHLVVVDPEGGGDRRPVAIETEDSYFIGPDNGIFWSLIEKLNSPWIVHLTEKEYFLPRISHTFHGRDIFAPVAAHISMGTDIRAMGTAINDPVRLAVPPTEN